MKIALDIDDTLADLHTEWLKRCNAEVGTAYTVEDMRQWDFWRDFGWTEEFIYKHLTPDIYNNVLPFGGALEVVNALRARGHEPVYVSSCVTQETWPWKVEWLHRYGFMTAKDQAFPVGPWAAYRTKGAVGMANGIRLLVDDSIANCDQWNQTAGAALLLSRPHNARATYLGKRLKKFEDLMAEVKYWPKGNNENEAVWSQVSDPKNWEAGGYTPLTPIGHNEDYIGGRREPDIQIAESIVKDTITHWQTLEIKPLPVPDIHIAASPEAVDEVLAVDSKPTNPKDAIGSDKLPLHLWPMTATVEGSLAMLEGALKYGRSNFRAIGVRSTIYVDACLRHLAAWMEGEDRATDSGISHLGHALACLAIIVDAREAGKLTDDRNISGGYLAMVDRLTPEVKRLKEKYEGRNPRHYTINDTEVL